jgi:hypothetical protein
MFMMSERLIGLRKAAIRKRGGWHKAVISGVGVDQAENPTAARPSPSSLRASIPAARAAEV